MKIRICSKCHKGKPLAEYYNQRDGRGGKHSQCKECCKKWVQKNKIQLSEKNRLWRGENKEKIREYNKKYQKEYNKKNKKKIAEKSRAWYLKNKTRKNKLAEIWYLKNKEIHNKRSSEWYNKNKIRHNDLGKLNYQKNKKSIFLRHRQRYNNDIQYRIKNNLRCRVYNALKGKNKSESTMELIGCSIEQLKNYLEERFTERMTWGNHGRFGWHIDHIKPCSGFDLSNPQEQKVCFHYSNLQPLWWRENISKGGVNAKKTN